LKRDPIFYNVKSSNTLPTTEKIDVTSSTVKNLISTTSQPKSRHNNKEPAFPQFLVYSVKLPDSDPKLSRHKERKCNSYVTVVVEYYLNGSIKGKNCSCRPDRLMYDTYTPIFGIKCCYPVLGIPLNNSSIIFSVWDKDRSRDELIGSEIKISLINDIMKQKINGKPVKLDIMNGTINESAQYYLNVTFTWNDADFEKLR
jgi:hypothetical protein